MDEKSKEFLNKRKFSRISLIDPIRLLTSEYAYEEYMGNISKTGCMILSLKNVEIGQKIKVAINCPDKGYINFDCEVKRSKEKDLEEIEAENKEIKDLLVVDDDQEVNETIVSALDENFGIQSCLNAKTARELLKIYNFRAVLCDARMPGEDGASLLEFIAKEQPECKRLLITGQADNELMQRAVNGGQIDKVFYKPVDMLGLKDILKQYVEQGAAFEAAKSTRQRYYNCYSCNYSAYRVDMVDGVKWETQNEGEREGLFHFFYHKSLLTENVCPKCRENSFMSITSKVFEVGLEFTELSKELDEDLNKIITEALARGSSGDTRNQARVDGNFVPIQLEKRFETGADLFDAYISDISRGGVRLEATENYNIGQRISLALGIVGSETTQVPAKIMHKTKVKDAFSYGLRFEYFDVDEQARLNHFIDGLALGQYRDREVKKQKKQLAVGVGGAGFSGFFGGVAASFILFGGFYLLSDYQLAKKERVITVSEGGKQYELNLGEVFQTQNKGLPKKLQKKLNAARDKCSSGGDIDENCLETELSKFSEVVEIPEVNIVELEKNILDKRSDIVPSDLDEFYIALEQERLSESEYRVRVEEFKIKVKRAIQLPKEKLK